MWLHGFLVRVGLSAWLISTCVGTAAEPISSAERGKRDEQAFAARGVVKELKPGGRSVLVSHEAISNFMDEVLKAAAVTNAAVSRNLTKGEQGKAR